MTGAEAVMWVTLISGVIGIILLGVAFVLEVEFANVREQTIHWFALTGIALCGISGAVYLTCWIVTGGDLAAGGSA